MGLTRRRWILALLGVVAALTAAVLAAERDVGDPIEVQGIFEEPTSFCGAWSQQSFRDRVDAVDESIRTNAAPRAAAVLTSGFLRRLARMDDAPGSMGPDILTLAAEVERRAGDRDGWRRQAEALDRSARTRCR